MRSILLLLLGTAAAALPATGAPFVFVDGDPNRACAGWKPCFSTIQEGIDRATAAPPPALVTIFPGVYPESVDLSAMGSAVAGSPGDLHLVAVTALGTPHPGTVTVQPPAGPALTASTPPFPGRVVIEGLRLTSPDADALDLTSAGAVELLGVTAQGASGRGAFVDAGGDVRVADSAFSANGTGGCVIDSGGAVVIERSTADGNGSGPGHHGFDVAAAAGSLDVDTCRAGGNAGHGFRVTSTPGSGVPVSLRNLRANGNGVNGIEAVPDGPLSGDGLHAGNNGGDGLRILATSGAAVDLRNVHATGNGTSGSGNGVSAAVTGALAIADSAARDNRDDGWVASAASATLSRVASSGNGGDGADVTTVSGPVSVTGAEFDGNAAAGLRASSGGAFDGSGVRAMQNGASGIDASAAGAATLAGVLASANSADGMRLLSTAAVSVTSSCARVNGGDGLRVAASGGDVTVTASELQGNAGAAIRLEAIAAVATHRIERNNVSGNGFGLRNDSVAVTVDAEDNWWGSATGPAHPSNPAGGGDAVVDSGNGGAGTVDFTPWLTLAAATETPCDPQPVPASGAAGLAAFAGLLAAVGARAMRRALS